MKHRTICALALLLLASCAWADEIRLKDGTKIIGTIVGFEDNSFKVQTSYGFALVRKDKVAAIIPSEPKPEPKKESTDLSKKPSPPEPQVVPAAAASAAPAAAPASARAPAPKKESHPAPASAAPSSPPPIREAVQGNLYINHTYGFRMYKPPGWHVIEDAQKTLPTAIAAMGTGDETTLLVIGRESLKTSLEIQAASTERQLREIYQRSEEHTS